MAPSVQQEQFDAVLPISVLPDDESSRMFLAGFRDCADEVLHYLVEVENMAEDDPVIIGLREHLAAQEEEASWRLCQACSDTDREHYLAGRLQTPVTKESLASTSTNASAELVSGFSDSYVLPKYRRVADTIECDCYYSESTDFIDTTVAEIIESMLLSNNLPATPELLQELVDGLCDEMTDSETSGVESMDED